MVTEQVISAWKLWEVSLIDDNTFFQIMRKLKLPDTTRTAIACLDKQIDTMKSDNMSMTIKQKNYIDKLRSEGKIPKDWNLDNLTKKEAQVVISEALSIQTDKYGEIPKPNIVQPIQDNSSLKRNLTEAEDGGNFGLIPPSLEEIKENANDMYADEGTNW